MRGWRCATAGVDSLRLLVRRGRREESPRGCSHDGKRVLPQRRAKGLLRLSPSRCNLHRPAGTGPSQAPSGSRLRLRAPSPAAVNVWQRSPAQPVDSRAFGLSAEIAAQPAASESPSGHAAPRERRTCSTGSAGHFRQPEAAAQPAAAAPHDAMSSTPHSGPGAVAGLKSLESLPGRGPAGDQDGPTTARTATGWET